tara:strand:+ start:28962 stop:30389 length:1428 start_codon:yes stop_codon:yes gene_type:complete
LNNNNNNNIETQVVVIGSGPGGYTAAFRAADLGMEVLLIDKDINLGGVCLNRGCIPSKAYLHLSHIIENSNKAKEFGVYFNNPTIDIDKIYNWKNSIIKNLSDGIALLAKQRKIKIINGLATFLSANRLSVKDNQNKQITIKFNYCIVATGSSPSKINFLKKKHPKIINSTQALSLKEIPKKMLVIGGGYIGLELGTAFASFGSQITVAEFSSNLLPMADQDLVQPLFENLQKRFKNIFLSTEVIDLNNKQNKVEVTFKKKEKLFKDIFDIVLVAIGRRPNTKLLNLDKAGIKVNDKGFIPVNEKRRTITPNIYAIGDINGNPMLAHKATHEAKVAAENISGLNSIFKPISIPSVIYTNPEIAWVGYTESELKNNKIEYNKAIFPWSASGRAMTTGDTSGKTKILTSKNNSKILGIGICGSNAGELIAEAMLAIEMGANPEDISLTIHPHPTLSETIANASEMLMKTITDLYIKN